MKYWTAVLLACSGTLCALTFAPISGGWSYIPWADVPSTATVSAFWFTHPLTPPESPVGSRPIAIVADLNSLFWITVAVLRVSGTVSAQLLDTLVLPDHSAARLSVRALSSFSLALLLTNPWGTREP